jgi:hypothetical protein
VTKLCNCEGSRKYAHYYYFVLGFSHHLLLNTNYLPTFQRYVLPPSSSSLMISLSKCSDLLKIFKSVRFQVLTAASMKFRIVFWDVLPCKIIVVLHFRGTCCLQQQHLWGWRQYVPLNRRTTIILHGSTSQKTILNNHKVDYIIFFSKCVTFVVETASLIT